MNMNKKQHDYTSIDDCQVQFYPLKQKMAVEAINGGDTETSICTKSRGVLVHNYIYWKLYENLTENILKSTPPLCLDKVARRPELAAR